MKKFTVIGYFKDNAQRFCGHAEAENADQAEKNVVKERMEAEGLDIAVCGVIEGEHKCLDTAEYVEF